MGFAMRRSHVSLGLKISDVRAVFIEPVRFHQLAMRTMFSALGGKRLSIFEDAGEALVFMMNEAPDVIVLSEGLNEIRGTELARVLRHASLDPLCRVPIILISDRPTPGLIEGAAKNNVNLVLARPLSASSLHSRLNWVLSDTREMVLKGDRWAIDGLSEKVHGLSQRRDPRRILRLLSAEQGGVYSSSLATQGLIDRILMK